jgi:hypothetical protein
VLGADKGTVRISNSGLREKEPNLPTTVPVSYHGIPKQTLKNMPQELFYSKQIRCKNTFLTSVLQRR